MLELAGYQEKKQLYAGSRTIVYRAIRAKDSQPVIIKVLRNPHPSFKELVQFRNQYIITRNLENPRIVRPIALERYGNGYALVMPDEGAIALPEYWQQSERNLREFLDIAIQLAEALHYLSQQRIIHKDIKPANILIHPETSQVQLIDFSISSLLPREQQQLINPNILEGTLAYISPEQTGRMNRGIDYRTDFYGLGATFFELLAGKLPFATSDPMELVHCHIAKMPPALGNREWGKPTPLAPLPGGGERKNVREIPQVIENIVMKLMAKNAENRYQSALGLKHDLERGEQELAATGEISQFELGTKDRSDRFLIPEKLYGREAEVKTLLAAFNRVAQGNTEMMLVAGFSGIGKTAVVNEVHKPILRQRGYFIKGKFDQFNRNIPFSAFVQAFRDLMGQLLGCSDAELATWKEKILAAVGENGQVLIEVIPELEGIIGKQPPAPELSGSATQNRFNLLFQKFIAVFTTPEHPLTMFLDDLQWADSASLNLIEVLMGSVETGYLLLLGAYRDNEVFPAHPLMLALSELEKELAVISRIVLEPLALNYTNQLVAETLKCSAELAEPLTELIYQKTKGNPFFATQFLKGLYEDELIGFNRELGYWECDLVKVRDAALTDDVVEFMAGRLALLPEATQKVLKLAACVGNQFELETLATICEESSEEVASDIWPALQEGLILPISEAYKFFQGDLEERAGEKVTVIYRFLHDRVQQASYASIADKYKKFSHIKIGRLLLQASSTNQQRDIFKIVNQFNQCFDLIDNSEEIMTVVKLNYKAATRARETTAFAASAEYAKVGIQLLTREQDAWETNSDLMLALRNSLAEAAYLSGSFDVMNESIKDILIHTSLLEDRLSAYEVKLQALKAQNKFHDAIALGLEVLNLLKIYPPPEATDSDVKQAFADMEIALQGRAISELLFLPEMSDRKMLAATRIISSLLPVVHMVRVNLLLILTFQQVKLALRYGNAPAHPHAYAAFGVILCGFMEDIERGYEAGQLALALLDRIEAEPFRSATTFVATYFTVHWKAPIQSTFHLMLKAYTNGADTGDIEHASFAAERYGQIAYFSGAVKLSDLVTQMDGFALFMRNKRQKSILQLQSIYHQAILNLQGRSTDPFMLVGAIYDETVMLPQHKAQNYRLALCYYNFHKLILAFLFARDPEIGIAYSIQAKQYIDGEKASILTPLLHTYDSLIKLQHYQQSCPNKQQEYLSDIDANQEKMKHWADFALMNYLHKYNLVEAEKCRVLSRKYDAMELYDRAIAGAKEHGFIQEEAIANELAAKFYFDWGKEKIATGYMQDAYYCYARWGAKAKTDQLETQYPQLLAPILQQPQATLTIGQTLDATQTLGTATSSSSSSVLDMVSAIKASQAISEEISLDVLLSKLMQVVLENAGADKGALILNQSGTWIIAAICVNGKTQLANIALEEAESLPLSIINTVKRSQETLIINEVTRDTTFAGDTYLIQQQPISLFCSPILHQGQIIGILYLENNLTPGAFTPDRAEVLNLLTAQAAISLENAQLYNTLEQKVKERTAKLTDALEELRATQKQLVESEKMAALGGLVAGVAHEINTPIGTSITLASTLADETQSFLGAVAGGQLKRSVLNNYLELAGDSTQLMLSNLHRAGELIQSFKQIATDQSNLEQRRFNLKEYLEEVALSLAPKLKQTPHTLTVAGEESITIESYPGALAQVTTNLVTNSLVHAYPSEQAGQLRLEISRESDKVKIEYSDDGCGIDRENKSKIFEPFFTTARHRGGTGLGLHIVYNLVTQKLLGTIAVESEVGSGTRFAMFLPESVN